MPQFRHPQISPRVKALFEKHGLDYDARGYFSCLGDTPMNLHNVGEAAQHSSKRKFEVLTSAGEGLGPETDSGWLGDAWNQQRRTWGCVKELDLTQQICGPSA